MNHESAMNHKEILQKARSRIQAGWCQGVSYEPAMNPTSYCLVGAIDAACGVHGSKGAEWTMANLLSSAVCEHLRPVLQAKYGLSHLIDFNDKSGRTKEEVLAVLDQAIASIHDGN